MISLTLREFKEQSNFGTKILLLIFSVFIGFLIYCEYGLSQDAMSINSDNSVREEDCIKLGETLVKTVNSAENLEKLSDEDWLCMGKFLGKQGNGKGALTAFMTSASLGNAEAQFVIGEKCMRIANESNDIKAMREGFDWSLKAADQNHPTANFLVGVCYAFGKGVKADPEKARLYFMKAADLGYEDSTGMIEKFDKDITEPSFIGKERFK